MRIEVVATHANAQIAERVLVHGVVLREDLLPNLMIITRDACMHVTIKLWAIL